MSSNPDYVQCMYMKTDKKKEATLKERNLRGADSETRRRRKADRAWWKVKCVWLWSCIDVSVLCPYIYLHAWTCMYHVHTNILIHERVCTMYVPCTYKYINSWTCMYYVHTNALHHAHVHSMYIHVHEFMNLYIHVQTCLYHVQTRTYRFAISCPGG